MTNRFLRFLFIILLAVPAFGITFATGGGATVNTPGVYDSITGASMAGMVVTFTYQTASGNGPANTPFTYVWQATGPTSGGVSFSFGQMVGYSITVDGSTSAPGAWVFYSQMLSPLLSIEFDGTAAGIYFDRSSPNPGSTGSGPGGDLAIANLGAPHNQHLSDVATVTYSNPVTVGGALHQGDLYSKMLIAFPCCDTIAFNFTQDTDATIPEPGTVLLVGFGLCGVAMSRGRKSPW